MEAKRYEVYGHDGRRWLIDCVRASLASALIRCDELANDVRAGFDVLRVVDTGHADGRERVIHEQTVSRRHANRPRMRTIKEAAYCERLADYYSLEARLTIGRLLRPFLDDARITALELLHDYTRLRRVMRDDRLYPLALNHIASLQAQACGRPAAERRSEIDRAVQQIMDQARGRHAYAGLSQALARGGLPAARAELPADTTPEQTRLHLSAAVARYLRDHHDWPDKLAALLDLLGPATDADPSGATVIDACVAEILQSAEALEALIGHPPSLGERVIARARLAQGRLHATGETQTQTQTPDFGETARDEEALAHRLSRLFAERKTLWAAAPETLFRQAASVLHGTRPLAGQKSQEAAAFERVVGSLQTGGGLAGGPEMADAVTRRARLIYGDSFEDMPPRPAVEKVTSLLSPRAAQIGYQLALAASPFGQKYPSVMTGVLSETLKGVSDRRALLAGRTDPRQADAMIRELGERIHLLETRTA